MLEMIKKIIPRRLFRALQPIYHYLLGFFSAWVYGFPSQRLIVIGVTGTAGKTSTVYLIAKLLASAGHKTGFTSTAVFSDGDQEWLNDKKMTMPGRFFIQRNLREMRRRACTYAVVETSSEGIKQYRHRFINYDVLVFTGLYPEHIESHGSFEKYKEAKGRLFAHLKECVNKYVNEEKVVCRPHSELKKLDLKRVPKTIIVNGDDEQAGYFLDFWSERKIIYGFGGNIDKERFLRQLGSSVPASDLAAIRGQDLEARGDGTSFTANGQNIRLKLLGEFNARNALAAYCVGLNQEIREEKIKGALESVSSLAGKLEIIDAGQNFTAIVDYSFEPRAIEKLYQVIDLIPHHRLIHLLGSAGGGRDKARRAVLGRLAAEKADFVIVTDEDPYDEDPADIINQVAAGAEMAGKINGQDLFKILDRREGIKKALELAGEGDLVLFTGKGAEQHICLKNGQKIPWNEKEIVAEEIKRILGR